MLGGLLADAAAMPLHWLYDTNTIKQLVGSGVPEFYKTPSCPFYKYPSGDNTPYGQQFQAYLSVGAATGSFAPTDVEKAYASLYSAAPAFWYKDESTKEFLANEAAGQHWPSCGGNDDQADAIVHALPVVALLAGKNTSAMLAAADAVIRVTQNTDRGAAFGLAASRVLEYVIAYNASGAQLLSLVIADLRSAARASPYSEDAALADGLQDALDNLAMSNFDYVQKVGQSCDWPFNLFTGAHLIAQLGGAAADYVSGSRQTILAGGLQFQLPVGNGNVYQNTGGLSLVPALVLGSACGSALASRVAVDVDEAMLRNMFAAYALLLGGYYLRIGAAMPRVLKGAS